MWYFVIRRRRRMSRGWNGAAILEKPVSDRGTLEDLSQSPKSPFKHYCKVLILKGRDVGVVD